MPVSYLVRRTSPAPLRCLWRICCHRIFVEGFEYSWRTSDHKEVADGGDAPRCFKQVPLP